MVTVTDNNGLVTTSSIKISEPDQLTATGFVLNCSQPGSSDGGINLTIRGGTHDYFLPGITVLLHKISAVLLQQITL